MGIGAVIAVGIGLLVGAMIRPLKMPKPKLDKYRPATSFSSGFAPVEIETTTPIPISFGRVQTNGHIIKGYVLGNNNNRLVGALALNEYFDLEVALNEFSIGGVRFEDLTTYSDRRSDDHSWYEFVPDGRKTDLHLANSGVKQIYQQLRTGKEYISDPIRIYGNAGLIFRFSHYASEAGSTQSWELYYRVASDLSQWTLLEAEPGVEFSQSIQGTAVAVNKQSKRSFSGFTANLYTFRLVVVNATNDGSVQWESIEVADDSGDTVSFQAPYCSYVLFNLIKTNEINRLNFLADMTCPFSNPAFAIRFLLTSDDFGFGSYDIIDDSSFDRAASYCDSNNITVGVTFSNTAFDEAISLLLSSSGLSLIKTQGIFKLLIDNWAGWVDVIDLDSDIVPGSLQIGSSEKRDVFNRLRVRYTDIVQNFTRNDILLEDTKKLVSDGYLREKTIDLSPITNMDWAQTIAERLYKSSAGHLLWCRFEVGVNNSWYEPGDALHLISDRLNWSASSPVFFRIVKMDEVLREDGLFGYAVYCELTSIDVYLRTMAWNDWVEAPDSSSTENLVIVKYLDAIKIINVSSRKRLRGTRFSFGDFSHDDPANEVWTYDITVTFAPAYGNNVRGYRLYGYHSALPSSMQHFSRIPNVGQVSSTSVAFRLENVRADCTWYFKVIGVFIDESGQEQLTSVSTTPSSHIDIPAKPTPWPWGFWADAIYERN